MLKQLISLLCFYQALALTPVPKYGKLVLEGNHGCPFCIVASQVAWTLQSLGMVKELIITRGGERHLPTFTSPTISLDWLNQYWFDEDAVITSQWNMSSPRIVFDGKDNLAQDCSNFLLANKKILVEANATLGLRKPITTEQWTEIEQKGCSALWIPAYCGDAPMGDMFLVDPAGSVRNDTSGIILYRDIGLEGGIFSTRDVSISATGGETWRPGASWCADNNK
jgi:hypothetical protein